MADESSKEPVVPRFTEALEVWALIAGQSFGGPAGQIAVMHKIVVEERRWLSEERFLHALNTCMLLPGPEAHQLVSYLGWLSHGYRGGLAAGALFVMPGFVTILSMSAIYVQYNHLPVVTAALLGLKAAVLAVVLDAVLRIGRRVLREPATIAVAIAAFCALFLLRLPFPLVVIAAGALGAALPGWFAPPAAPEIAGSTERPLLDALADGGALPHIRPVPARDAGVALLLAAVWLAPTAALWAAGAPDVWVRVPALFSTAAVVSFGGAYAVLAYVAQQAVMVHAWLGPGEMLDGLGLAETTPGPLIQVVQFVGFLATYRAPGAMNPMVAGSLGSVLTTWVTFLPSFLFILAGGPYVERIRKVRPLASALRGITAAVVGVVANLGVWLTLHTAFGATSEASFGGGAVQLVVPDLTTFRLIVPIVAVPSAYALIGRKWPIVPVLAIATVVGLGWWLVGLVVG